MFVGDQAQVLFCAEPVDMRKHFNGLAGLVRDTLKEEPLAGKLFVFVGKRGDTVKILYWHHNGFAVWSKKLQKGRFSFPAGDGGALALNRRALRMILEGFDLTSMQRKSA
jgi:transposase